MTTTYPPQKRQVAKGEIIIRQGDPGHAAYVVHTGKFEVFTTHDSKDVSLAVLGPGDIVGEMAMLFDTTRSASVRAITDGELIILDHQTILKHLSQAAPNIRTLVKVLSERVKRSNRKLAKTVSPSNSEIPAPSAAAKEKVQGS